MMPAEKLRVGIIGLGHIGRVHLAALRKLSGFRVSAICDQDPRLADLAPEGTPFFNDPAAFFSCSLDVIVVATPNHTHGRFALQAMSHGYPVIVEKPAAESLVELDAMLAAAKAGTPIDFAFHAAHGREVVWTRQWLREEGSYMGPVTGFNSLFIDPYAGAQGGVTAAAASLGDAWLDSGINALSVLSGFIDMSSLNLVGTDVRRRSENGVVIDLAARFNFPTPGSTNSGLGVIATRWTKRANNKQTRLDFGMADKSILLDHSAQIVALREPENGTKILADFSGSGERLFNHYLGVFSAYAARKGEPDGAADGTAGRRLHEILFAVASEAKRTGSERIDGTAG